MYNDESNIHFDLISGITYLLKKEWQVKITYTYSDFNHLLNFFINIVFIMKNNSKE